MSTPKISIITVVYNAKELLSKTLDNIIAIDYPNKEIIVIDGGSTDGTKDVIISKSLDIQLWISEKDNGIYDAMNKGLRMATGDYIWYINAGDFVYSEDILNHIFKGKETYHDIYYGDTLVTDEDGNILGLRKKKPPIKLTTKSFLNGMVVCHQSFIAKKSILPPFDLNYKHSADYNQMILAVKSAKSTYKISSRIISIFTNGGHTSKYRIDGLKERYEIMKKQFGLLPTIVAHIGITLKSPLSHYRKASRRKLVK